MAESSPRAGKIAATPWRRRLDRWLPKVSLVPSGLASLIFVYGFIAWTIWLSLTNSTLLPTNNFAGLRQYKVLFQLDIWWVSVANLAIFGILYVAICLAIGLFLAIMLDQKIRAEGWLRTIYLYPLALSLVVTGVVWKWLLNPSLGLQHFVQSLGWTGFSFDWLINPHMAIYTVVIAAVWQASGFVTALFLAGLRGIDSSIIKAAQIDGASLPRVYLSIIIPSLRPVFFSAIILLVSLAIKSFDLVIALTNGGPGYSTWLPAIFMYDFGFNRGQIGLGAAAATLMMAAVALAMLPMLIAELKERRDGRSH
ncbi:carbohydrate ABC transporter permease [Salinisphaera hydrothermalis]|uniref:Binding-protein-dependent transport system inner membrane protein n=1 Tax=Salinisphaera hydrothermalis (strain C41B8) TaxID=1304275 RepID=A0A084INJ9_SALHC|nr:sugar ABC transporter permease [Salinisphaera hydrothermalis]KEZ78283.1 binding-protein-dependent transport system inner membrane protein [Salinisphaera hydrothermalis C41B8]